MSELGFHKFGSKAFLNASNVISIACLAVPLANVKKAETPEALFLSYCFIKNFKAFLSPALPATLLGRGIEVIAGIKGFDTTGSI